MAAEQQTDDSAAGIGLPELKNIAQSALQMAQEAVAGQSELETRLDELEAKNEQLEFRITELELKADAGRDQEYELLTRRQKHQLIIEDLFRRAESSTTGRAKVDYKNVRHGVFDSNPSADHCYDLMEEVGEQPGFDYIDNPENGNIHLRVDLEDARELQSTNADSKFSPANKQPVNEGA